RALALVALVKGPARGESARLEALLADTMGYPRAARDAAAALAADDPVRAYVTRDDARLAALSTHASDRLTGVLRLRRLAHTHDAKGEALWRAQRFARDEYTLPVLGARLIAPEIGTERIVAFAMPELVVLAAESRAGDARAIGTAAELAKWT